MLRPFAPAPQKNKAKLRPIGVAPALNLTLAAWVALGAHISAHAQAQADTPAGIPDTDKTTGQAAKEQLPPIVVRGRSLASKYPGGQVARGARLGMLGDTEVLDAPFSVTAYTAQAAQDQQAATASEVIANDPSVRISVQPGGVLDAFYIRGLPVNEGNVGEFALDGVFGVAPTYRVFADYVERIELIKGPTSLLYGMAPNSGVGGSVNIAPKRATAADVTQLGLEYGNGSQAGARIDVSRRFGAQREFGVRVNASARGGDTPLDKQTHEASSAAVALDYQGSRLRTTLDIIGQREHFDAPSRPIFLRAVAAVPTTPAAPDAQRNLTQPWEWSQIDDQSALLRAEYDLNDAMTVFAAAGGGRTQVDRLFGNPVVTNASGDVSWTPTRWELDVRRTTADVGARTNLRTGSIDHAVTLQATQYRDRISRGQRSGTAVASNLYAPTDSPAQAVAEPDSITKVSETELTGVALADTLSMADRRVLLTLGVRAQQVKSDNFDTITGALTLPRYDARATTPLVGLVVKPWQRVSLYGNYVEGLSKGDVAPTTASNAGAVLAPYKAKQIEAGVKFDQGRMTTTVAVFQITKPSGQLTGAVYTADAEQRNRGIEVHVVGEASSTTRVLGGLTLLDAELVRSSNATTLGKQPIGVPKVQANLGAEWDTGFLPGVTLTGTVSYAGQQYVDGANLRGIPAWTRFDVGARWRTALAGKATTFRANVRNLFDRDYWSGVSSFGGLAQGAPRTLQLSATVDF